MVGSVPLLLTGSDAIAYFLNGMSRGMIIFLTASGLTLIFGLIGLINFAHGALFTLSGYITMSTVQYTGNFWLGLGAGIALTVLLGFVLERALLNRLYDEEPLLGFLATFGLGPLLLGETMKMVFGGQTHSVPSPFEGSVTILSVSYPSYRLFVIFAGLAVAAVIGALLSQTRFGIEIYATTVDTSTAEILGTNTQLIYTSTFLIGVGLAALAGGLISPITGVFPDLGLGFMLIAFLVIIVGGMGSFKGSFIASVLAGELISFGSLVVSPTYASMGVFLLAMLVILFRPTGFFGKTQVLE